jgi:serine/threonine protein kinase
LPKALANSFLGVIHGDLKLANIVVFSRSEDAGGGVVPKIIDFSYSCLGVAKDERVSITGTPLWWPPGFDGRPLTVAEAMGLDLYSLALVVASVLAYNAIAKSDLEVFTGIPQPSQRLRHFVESIKKGSSSGSTLTTVFSSDTSIPPDKQVSLTRFLEKALSPDPEHRYKCALDIVLELADLQGPG